MFDSALDFIGGALKKGLSTVENGAEDAVHAVGQVFSGNSGTYTPPSQANQVKTAQSPISLTSPAAQAQNQAKFEAPNQPTSPNPLKLNLSQPSPPPAPKLAFNNVKTQNLPGSFNTIAQPANQQGGGGVDFLNKLLGPTIQSLAKAPSNVAKFVSNPSISTAINNNPTLQAATQNQAIKVNGKWAVNPKIAKQALGAFNAVGSETPKPLAEPPDFLKPSAEFAAKNPLRQSDAQTLANLSPKEQMALTKPTELNPAEVNTTRNPYKANLPQAEPGNFGQVIANEQAASKPIAFAGDRWTAAMKELTPEERTNFWRSVEKPGDPSYSPRLSDAIDKWRQVDDRIHGTSQELGGNTNYLTDHALHPWDLPEDLSDHIVNGGNPDKFPGINNLPRTYRTIEEGERLGGLKLGDDPIHEGQNYIGASAALLKRRAIAKGLAEADSGNEAKTRAFDIGGGNSIPISDEAARAVRGLQRSPASTNVAIKGLRTVNTAVKSSILSLGQFHPINIAALRAGPTLALPKPSTLFFRNAETGKLGIDPTMSAHPIRAIKGVYGTNIRALLPGGKAIAERMKTQAVKEGMDVKAAKIGAPYGAGGFDEEGSFIKGGLGHERVFDIQMPMMHDQAVRSVVSDLEKRGISLDSPEARTAGKAVNNMMGFVNSEAQKIPPRVNRALGDFLLAKQFTASKFSQDITAVSKGGVGGAYARANVAANVAATTAIIVGLGYAMHQKSDNLKDMLLRALISPAVPSNQKDSKGNTIDYRTPGTDTSDLAKLLGITLKRNADGHLGVNWKPGNAPATVESFLRDRLSPFASAGVKVATNTTYAGKPMFDPNASTGTQAAQAGTSIATGLLPIGLQGLAYNKTVKNALPGSVQQVLNAQTPGTNPLLKSIGSSFGLTPSTDVTVGKGLQTSQFYNAAGDAKSGLNAQAARAVDQWIGSKKNPVTGAYDVQPNVNDTRDKAVQLLDNPSALDHMIQMNQTLKSEGQKTDPLWDQSKDKITAYLQYQAMPPGGPDQVNWRQNNPWYDQGNNSLYQQRNDFFNSLPPGDPNKPAQPIQYPLPDPTTAQDQNTYFSLYSQDPASAQTFLQSHQDVQDQMDKQAAYNNDLRQAEGYGALRTYPKPSTYVQGLLNSMAGMTSKQKAAIYNDPQVAAWSQADAIYNLTKGAGLAQIQGNSLTSKDLKATQSLQYDILKNPNGTLGLKFGDSQGGVGATAIQAGAKPLGGASGTSHKIIPLPKKTKIKMVKIRRAPKMRSRVKLAKTQKRISVKSATPMKPVQVARPTSVVKLAG